VREAIRAGISAIHIEDQQIPKRLGYHVGVKYVIPIEEMMVKLRVALDTRGDSNMLVIARTDSREAQNGSLEDAVERCHRFIEAGADVVMPYNCRARSLEEATYVGQQLKFPMLYVNDESEYPNLTVDQLAEAGFKIIIYPLTPSIASAQAMLRVYSHLKDKGVTWPTDEYPEVLAIRKRVEENMGIFSLWDIESRDNKRLG